MIECQRLKVASRHGAPVPLPPRGRQWGTAYAGISDDWTRRIREHWRTKPWAAEIFNVNLEIYPDRPSVVAAERHVIRSEGPLHNVQHNRGALADPEHASNWSAEDVLIVVLLVIAGAYLLYKVTEAGVAQYREWKADRDEVLLRARSSGAGGQPLEIQLLEFPSAQALGEFMTDGRRQSLAGERDRVIAKTEIIEVHLVQLDPRQ